MKIKIDFVTNSSSASFSIVKSNLTDEQIAMIYDHINVGLLLAGKEGDIYTDPEWEISENEIKGTIDGFTLMDNFDMLWFLKAIGVKEGYIDYDGSDQY